MSASALAHRLARQTEVQHRLLSLADAQETALRRGDLRELRVITAEQEAAVLDCGRLEREREQEALTLCAQLGLDATGSVDDLVAALPAEEASALEREARELRSVIRELQLRHGRNTELIEQELVLIDHLVRHVILDESAHDTRVPVASAPLRLVDREV